jgi:hypothetical protein
LRHLRIAAGLRRGEEERQREQHRDECRPDERVLAYVWSLVAGIHYPSTILTLCRDKLSIENPGDEHHALRDDAGGLLYTLARLAGRPRLDGGPSGR